MLLSMKGECCSYSLLESHDGTRITTLGHDPCDEWPFLSDQDGVPSSRTAVARRGFPYLSGLFVLLRKTSVH